MAQLLGTVVASPVVQGNSDIDSYGTHYSFLGVGGYQEYLTLAERDSLLIDPLSRLGGDGLSTGRRRLGMLVFVAETNTVYQLNIPYATWQTLTDAQKVAALANNANWVEFTAGNGGGDAIKKRYFKQGHGFTIGTVVAFNSVSGFVPKIASASNTDETLGMVSRIDDVDNFTVTYAGFINTSGITGISASTVYYVSPFTAGAITTVPPIGLGEENRPILITQSGTSGLVVQYRGQIITESNITGGTGTTNVAGVIGPAEDGTYADGLFTDFIPTTPTGTAVDRFNEVLKALAPTPAPALASINRLGAALNSARLSFGPSEPLTNYSDVTTAAGNPAVDVNGVYAVGATRLGVMASNAWSGTLNSAVPATTAYAIGAFGEGDIGKLEMHINGVLVSQIMLSGGTGATANARFTLSAVSAVTFTNGQPLNLFKYRTGTFTIPSGAMGLYTGFTYVRIVHNKGVSSSITNFLDFVVDRDITAMTAGSQTVSGTTTGSKYISGVRYHTSGTATYQVTINNAYRNVYPNGNAISYPSRTNLSDAVSIEKSGSGLVSETNAAKTFPIIDTATSNPQLSPLTLKSVHTLQNNIIGFGSTGTIGTNVSIIHPLKSTLTGGAATASGFLVYTPVQVTNGKIENFTGEIDRLENREYSGLTYAAIDGGTYVWQSTQSLVGANAQHNNGSLVLNGELMYPNAAYLNSQYGIANGNFGSVTNGYAGNPNYTAAAGERVYTRKFKSSNAATQSTLTIQFTNTGSLSSFLTDGGTGGTPVTNFIKVEMMIKRAGGQTHGWFNPFASVGNPEGIAVTSASHAAGVTSVSCTLSTVPRVGNGDIVIMRIRTASGWTNRISNINVVNI